MSKFVSDFIVEFPDIAVLGTLDVSVSNLVLTALRSLGWDSIFVNEHLRLITALKFRRELVMNTNWEFEFHFRAHWTQAAEAQIKLSIEVQERKYPFTKQNCQEQSEALVAEFLRCKDDLPSRPVREETKGAAWATAEDLRTNGLIDSDYGPGNLLFGMFAEEYMRACEQETNKHGLIIGVTGAGKSIFLSWNMNLRTGRSALVTEATGSGGRADLYCKTSGYRKSLGHKIYYVNPDDLASHRINPLLNISTYRDVSRIVEIIMQSTTLGTHRGDQTWEMAERLFLTALILHAVGEKENGKCNLAYVHDLIYEGVERVSETLAKSRSVAARETFRGFANNSNEKFTSLVAQGLATRLSLWADPRIRALTEETDIDTESLHQDLFTWYLSVPAHKRELKPLAALFFNFAFELVTLQKGKYGLNLFLDELPNFGYVSGLTQKLTILRHDKIPVLIAIQDLAQLELSYGKEWVLFLSQTATKIFFRPNDLRTADTISRALGGAETVLPQVTSSGQLTELRQRHQLLSPEELMKLKDGQMIVMTPRTAPCKIQGVHWSACSNYEIEFPPPQREPLAVDETLRLEAPDVIEEIGLEALTVSAHSHLQTEYENELYGSW